MKRRDFIRNAATIFLSVGVALKLTAQNIKPNFVFFLIDDLGWTDLSCYGSKFYETPAIDNLAKQGIRFTDAYTAHPRCVPARVGIMTGKYPARLGVPGGKKPDPMTTVPLSEITIGEALKENEYKTFYTGKWHLGKEDRLPANQGFDIQVAVNHLGSPTTYHFPYKYPSKTKATDVPDLEDGKKGDYLTDELTDKAIGFIKANSKKPFLAFVSHYAVHTPLEGKEELIKKYEKILQENKLSGNKEFYNDPSGTGTVKIKQDNTTYAAMIQSVDESVGRIMKTLKQLKIEDNTVIILTSDNGGLSTRGVESKRGLATSNDPLRTGKGWVYEGGIRVPLIVKWPGVAKPGIISDALITGTDYYPTMLEICNSKLKPEQHLDGVSFAGVLKGKNFERKPVFWHSPQGRPAQTGDTNATAVRHGDYKLIEWFDEGRVELFNLKNDISEKKDLSKKHPEKTRELLALLHSWRKEVNAVTDVRPFKGGKSKKRKEK